MKELLLWIYTASIAGHERVLLVADHTVGGAKTRFSTAHGTPSIKNAIPASSPGFPAWIKAPGAWVSIVPIEPTRSVDKPRAFQGLDRYSQDCLPKRPEVLPDQESAYLPGDSIREAQHSLETLIAKLLKEQHSDAALKPANG